jgi:ABC-type multidrug transport system fused ATPase/permease subunit
VDLRRIRLKSFRSLLGIVQQEVFLFDGSVRENIAYGRTEATEAEVRDAARRANADEFISRLPEGYDTLIGERGVNLSGGQRQRVALARALVTGARVVVLDDPLSAVDTLTERRLVARLRPALSGRTVVVATQRLSTVEIADRAVVLVDGRIVESGTPAELLRADGAFAALFGDEVIAA